MSDYRIKKDVFFKMKGNYHQRDAAPLMGAASLSFKNIHVTEDGVWLSL